MTINCFFFLYLFIVKIALLAVSAIILFAIEIDDIDQRFIVTKGISFYLQVLYSCFFVFFFICSHIIYSFYLYR